MRERWCVKSLLFLFFTFLSQKREKISLLKERASEFYHKEEERRGKKEKIKQKNRSGDSSIYCFASRKKINVRFIFFPATREYQRDQRGSIYSYYRRKIVVFQQQNCAQCIFRIPRLLPAQAPAFPTQVKAGIACLSCIRMKMRRIRAIGVVYARNSQCIWLLSYHF